MKTPNSESRDLPPAQAFAEIAAIEQQTMQMGGNDREPADFAAIRQALTDGRLSPDEAVLRAKKILNNKQDYH